LHEEIRAILTFVKDVMAVFGFPYELEVSTRPEKSIGSNADWEMATKALVAVLDDEDISYEVNEGEGAFYGPKIDVKLQDALGRQWQCATIQCDFTMPERFDLSYIGSDGEKHRPVMLHRVILGAMERFIGILIEHYGGAFPLWLAPVQAVILTVTDRNIPYGEGVYQRLFEEGVRVEQDFRNEKLGFKIREAQVQKIPYMLVIGDKEQDTKTIAPRRRDGTDLKGMELDQFLSLIHTERTIPEPHITLKEVKGHREQARPCQ
jgi:threonyl-tRNA synthetase